MVTTVDGGLRYLGKHSVGNHPSNGSAFVARQARHERVIVPDYQINTFRGPHTAIAYLRAVTPSERYGKSYSTFPRDNQREQNP